MKCNSLAGETNEGMPRHSTPPYEKHEGGWRRRPEQAVMESSRKSGCRCAGLMLSIDTISSLSQICRVKVLEFLETTGKGHVSVHVRPDETVATRDWLPWMLG